MTSKARWIQGQPIADFYLKAVERNLRQIRAAREQLTLATVQIGHAKDLVLYSHYLSRLLKRLGIQHIPSVFQENESETAVLKRIADLNEDPGVTGVLIFSPIPKHFSPVNLVNHIDLRKDVEGRTFLKNHFGVFSPTANAALALIESRVRDLSGKQAVVVGHSDPVGKPTAVLLMDKMATVTVCHAKTRNLSSHLKKADIVVAAVGKPGVVRGRWIKKGAVVIDVGENMVRGKVTGDVEFKSAEKRASFISPVPGGVGPVTNVMLIRNLIQLHKWRRKTHETG